MSNKFLRWAIITALKLLFIIASPRDTYFGLRPIRQQIEAAEEEA